MTAPAIEALPYILASMFAATALSFVVTPLTIRFARQLGAIERPGWPGSTHRRPMPRAGGLAVTGAFVLVGFGALGINEAMGQVPRLTALDPTVVAVLVAGVLAAAGVGFIHDRAKVPAVIPTLAPIGLGALVVAGGVLIGSSVKAPGPALVDASAAWPWPVAAAITVLWVLAVTRGIAVLDRLDGLGAGAGVVGALAIGAAALVGPSAQPFVSLLAAVLAGSAAGFVPWNFHPARVLIGRSGVLAVGYGLAVAAVLARAEMVLGVVLLGVLAALVARAAIRRVHARTDDAQGRLDVHGRRRRRPLAGAVSLARMQRRTVTMAYAACGILALVGVLGGHATGSSPLLVGTITVSLLVMSVVAARHAPDLARTTYATERHVAPPRRHTAVRAARRELPDRAPASAIMARRPVERRGDRTDDRRPDMAPRHAQTNAR